MFLFIFSTHKKYKTIRELNSEENSEHMCIQTAEIQTGMLMNQGIWEPG